MERLVFSDDDRNPEEPEPMFDLESEPEKKITTKRMKKPKTKNEFNPEPLLTNLEWNHSEF